MNEKHPEMGDIIRIDFNPQIGVEITKHQPALVVSRTIFISHTNFVWVCPISSTIKKYPTHFSLDEMTKTQGEIKVSQIRALDYNASGWTFLEKAPTEILMQVKHLIDAITNVSDELYSKRKF